MMRQMDDQQLLETYAGTRSEAAFAELVRRHVDWVYSAARRQVRDPHLAQDVTQAVFILLARKAAGLRRQVVLGGWLFRTTRFVACRALRADIRRQRREQIAFAMNSSASAEQENDVIWAELAPHLDEAVAALSEKDRLAVLLRFYQKKTMSEVGSELGISEEAAKKRVHRAIEKMRAFLLQRGVRLGSVTLGSLLAARIVEAAPPMLAAAVLKSSVAAVAGSLLLPELVRQTLNAWFWAKLKLGAILVGLTAAALVLLAEFRPVPRLEGPQPSQQFASRSSGLSEVQPTVANPQNFDATQPSIAAMEGWISGLVLDQEGRPIANAEVWRGFDPKNLVNPKNTRVRTDAFGQFMLETNNATHWTHPITVTADGFVTDQQDVDTNHLSAPLIFHLTPVTPLRFRVIDADGQPIVGAEVMLDDWWGRDGFLHFRRPTDADGRVAWLAAAKGELEFCASKPGYKFSRDHKFVADDAEHTFVLHRELIVSVKLTDAESGELIPRAKFVRGYSRKLSSGETPPIFERPQLSFATNGLYRVIFNEEHIPHLQVEAEGYDLAVVNPQPTNGFEASCDIALQRTNHQRAIRGTVFLPNGKAAARVEVALCTFRVGTVLVGAGFDGRLTGNEGGLGSAEFVRRYRCQTDSEGWFSFEPQPGAHTVVAVAAAGLGKAHCFDSSEPLEIRLQAWGRIEGVVRTRDGQWAGRKVAWGTYGQMHSGMGLDYTHQAFTAITDSEGKFVLETIPAGEGRVQLEDSENGSTLCITPVVVKAGETVTVQLGGNGVKVTGRLVAPEGIKVRSWSKQIILSQMSTTTVELYDIPEGLEGEALWRWQIQYSESEAGQKRSRAHATFTIQVADDGSFVVPEVSPGNYTLFFHLKEGPLGSGPSTDNRWYRRGIAQFSRKLTIEDPSANAPWEVDLGELVLWRDP